MIVRVLSPEEFDAATGRFGEILADAVAAGAGVSFMLPFSAKDGEAYWRGLSGAVRNGAKTILIARTDKDIAGVVILEKAWPPNQPHRGEVAKLLVHRDYRRQGIGTLLMRALETKAREMGLTLITFDAVAHGPVEAFYRDLDFTCAGYIPGYAFSIGDEPNDTAIFYKQL
jgi:GNAT superfamily N-acetyltransferase